MKNCMEGIVVSGVGGFFHVLIRENGKECRLCCRARGNLRREEARVLVGDHVVVETDIEEQQKDAVIVKVLPRNNSMIRPPLANLDTIYAVLSVAEPSPILETTDKLLAIAEHNHINCVIILTKIDLDVTAAARLSALYRAAGYMVFCVSANCGDGIDALAVHLRDYMADGRIAAFTGASGVGKSSLLNALFPSLSLVTGEISKKIGRGKNTTRHVELYPVFGTATGGFLADTPGFSMLDFSRFDFMTWQELPYSFREFAPYHGACRYADCNHIKEEACAIRCAVAEGKVALSRYESYATLYTILRSKSLYGYEK